MERTGSPVELNILITHVEKIRHISLKFDLDFLRQKNFIFYGFLDYS